MTGPSTHDRSGKRIFDDIYDAADPRAYWRTLGPLDYRIPHHAQEVFSELVEARRRLAAGDPVTITDLCCSYGVTAALLKYDCTLEDLCDRYCSEDLDALSSDELAARDASFYAERRQPSPPRVIGLDTAANAVSYALEAGLLDAGSSENLEDGDPSPRLQRLLSETDLVTVTGGVGYIGEQTFDRVLSHVPASRCPWVAAFVLRWVAYEPIAEALAGYGLVTEQLTPRTFPQRRFADDAERDAVLNALAEKGIDPRGKEDDGQHHTSLYLTRPKDDVIAMPLDEWFASSEPGFARA